MQTWGFEPHHQSLSGVMCTVIAEDVAADPEQQGQEKGKERLSGHLKIAQGEDFWSMRRQLKMLEELGGGQCDGVWEGGITNCDL